MRKIIIGILILLNSSFMFSQQAIVSVLTNTHKQVRGSKIKMVPPTGFLPASSFKGYQQSETNASIMVLDIPKPLSETITGLNAESLMKQGVKVTSIEEIIFNRLPALIIRAEQTINEVLFTKYIFVIGTDKETILINGLAPQGDILVYETIISTILSTVYEPEKIIMPLDDVDFEINTKESDFILAKIFPNMLIYNKDGKIPTAAADNASLVIAKTFSEMLIGDKKSFALNKIRTLPIQISKIFSSNPIAINGAQGYEVIAEGINRKTGLLEHAYQVILFFDDGYYIIYGSSEGDSTNNLALFKKIALTFKLK